MNGLIMHCGAEAVPLPQLMQIPTPPPTRTHFPIPHHQFFDMAQHRLLEQGYQITNPRHYLNREGAHYFSLLQLRHEDEEQDKGHATMCALRNSHDKIFSASIAIGAKVFVCDNLSFSGDIVVGKKHSMNIMAELPGKFDEAIGRIRIMQKRQEVRFAEYKQAPLDDRTADHLVMECYRRGIVNLQRIGAVNREWLEPTVDHGDKRVWRFFNATTAALKAETTNQLITMPKKTIDLHLLLDEFVDLPEIVAEGTEKEPGWISRMLN